MRLECLSAWCLTGKMVRDAEINLKDAMLRGYKEFGVRFEVTPVSGHNYMGLV